MSNDSHGDADIYSKSALKRLVEQLAGTDRRSYSDGRIGPDDDGDLAFAIAVDKKHKVVRVDFTKPVEWFAMDAVRARILAAALIAKADELESNNEQGSE